MDAKDEGCVSKLSVEKCSPFENGSFSVRDLRDGSEGHEQGNLVLEVVLVGSESSEHLGGSLGVTNVSNLLSGGLALDMVDHGREIVGAHVVPGEVPVLGFVLVVVKGGVTETVCVATGVAEPDIVAGASGHEGGGNIGVVDDPTVGGVEDAVLEEHRGLQRVGVLVVGGEAGDTENIQDVAVIGSDHVVFIREAVFGADLLEGHLGVRVAVGVVSIWVLG